MAERRHRPGRDGLKALLTGGMLFEELGFRYIGPIDGHDLPTLRRWLRDVKDQKGPVLLHVLTEKGHGVPQASEDPVTYHTPPVFEKVGPDRTILSLKRGGSQGLHRRRQRRHLPGDAGRPDGHGHHGGHVPGQQAGEGPRRDFPDRFFDIGICESHAVAFAAGHGQGRHAAHRRHLLDLPAALLRPDLPGSGPAEPAGDVLPRPRRPDRSRRPDASRRLRHAVPAAVPELRRHGPRRRAGRGPDAALRPGARRPGVACAIPRRTWRRSSAAVAPVELGQAEVYEWGDRRHAHRLRQRCSRPASRRPSSCAQEGLDVGVINARFAKPLDRTTLLKAVEELPLVVTVEEGTLEGGFGSALLEAANAAGLDTRNIVRLGMPDRFIEHAERGELLAPLGLDVTGICRRCGGGWDARPPVVDGVAVAR